MIDDDDNSKNKNKEKRAEVVLVVSSTQPKPDFVSALEIFNASHNLEFFAVCSFSIALSWTEIPNFVSSCSADKLICA